MNKKVRRLCLGTTEYGWRVTAGYQHTAVMSTPRIYVIQFMAFRDKSTSEMLRIKFIEGLQGGPEYIPRSGVVLILQQRAVVNFNKPRTASVLIGQALRLGWLPTEPMTVENGFGFIEQLPIDELNLVLEPLL